MKELKKFLIFIVLWFIFGRLSAHLVGLLAGMKTDEMIGISCAFLPGIVFLVYAILQEAKMWLHLLFGVFIWFINIFRRKKRKEQEMEEEEVLLTKRGRNFIVLSVIVYGIVGSWIARFLQNEYCLFAYAFVGLCWGVGVYVFEKKEWISREFY